MKRESVNGQPLPRVADQDNNSPTFHYHFDGGSYYHRPVYYHDHPGSFLFGADDEIIHDHQHTPAVYVNEVLTRDR